MQKTKEEEEKMTKQENKGACGKRKEEEEKKIRHGDKERKIERSNQVLYNLSLSWFRGVAKQKFHLL